MKKLSLCLIVKNEENSLDDCLKNSKKYADEIIIVDTGSTDKTKEIAKKYTNKIFDFKWCDDFSKARNYSFSKATNEYIMWLDGDDIILENDVNEIIKWKNNSENCDVLMCKYVVSYDDQFNSIFEYYRERIVKKSPQLCWQDRVHEVIVPHGKIIRNENIKIFHNKKQTNSSERNLNIYRDMKLKGEYFSPRNQFYFARELYFNGYIAQAVQEFKKFLEDEKGWVENKIEAHLNLAKCYCLQKEYDMALSSLYASFVYDLPRGEILYEIGNVYVEMQDFNRAIYWFKLALSARPETEKGGFVNKDCITFLPALQLCYCYFKLGDNCYAFKYHKLSQKYRPKDAKVQHNENYFKNLYTKKQPN
ncbi:MAG: glycosyltransferase [Clostridia bacterium]|nr:glycosyltransferase [Clostridia bacterium]